MNRKCTKPSDSYDWLSADDLLKNILAVYYGTCRKMAPPPGEPFSDPEIGDEWSNREGFKTTLLDDLNDRIYALYEERVIHKCTAACAEAERAM